MPSSLQRPVDMADVQALLDLEPQVRKLIEAIVVAMPAAKRLKDAKYAGAGWVLDQLGGGDPRQIAEALEAFGAAAGDLAAHDYHRLVVLNRMSLQEAADEVYEAEFSAERVERFRRYAARKEQS